MEFLFYRNPNIKFSVLNVSLEFGIRVRERSRNDVKSRAKIQGVELTKKKAYKSPGSQRASARSKAPTSDIAALINPDLISTNQKQTIGIQTV